MHTDANKMTGVLKDSNLNLILTLSCIMLYGVYIARFLKYVWPFYNIMHERVKDTNFW